MVCVLILTHSEVLQIIMLWEVLSGQRKTPPTPMIFFFLNQDLVMSLNWSGNRNKICESVVINNSLAV